MNHATFPDGTLAVFGEMSNRWTAIASEIADYSKRYFDDGSTTFAKLMAARSVDQAIEIQTEFAQRAYDAHLRQMTKLVNMYAEFAKVPARAKQ